MSIRDAFRRAADAFRAPQEAETPAPALTLDDAVRLVTSDYRSGPIDDVPASDAVSSARRGLDLATVNACEQVGDMTPERAEAYRLVLGAGTLSAGDAARRVERTEQAAEVHDLAADQGRTIETAAYYVHLKTETGGDDTVLVVAETPTQAEAVALHWNPTAVDAVGAYPADLGVHDIEPPTRGGMDDPGDYYADGGFDAAIAVAEAEQRAADDEAREDDRAGDDDGAADRAGDARIPVDQ